MRCFGRFTKALVVGGVVAVGAPAAAQAATFTVTTTSDANNGACTATACSLREAVIAANAAGGVNTISLPSGHYLLSIAPTGSNDATSGDLNVTSGDSLSVVGAGVGSTIIDGGGIDRDFDVASGSSLNISGVTLTGGNVAAGDAVPDGGAILNSGTVYVFSVAVAGNQAPLGNGGAVNQQNTGTTTINSSTFSGNTAGSAAATSGALGGGVHTDNGTGGTLTILDSTFTANVVTGSSGNYNCGGALDLDGGSVTVTNSTLTGNVGEGRASCGGAVDIDSGEPIQFSSDTIAFNSLPENADPASVGDGAGVWSGGASNVHFQNTIVAHNTRGIGASGTQTGTKSEDCDAAANSNPGNNLDSDGTCFTGSGDLHGDPQLSALSSYGGPTQTLAISATSLARDHGNSSVCPSTDQRGVVRPVGAACDIGAFELDPPLSSGAPAITGTAHPLRTLTCSRGSWTGSPFQAFTYQWNRSGSAIAGATASTYTVKAADVGHQLICSVTSSTAGDGSATATSPAVTARYPSNAFSIAKVVLNKHKGTATVTVKLPGPGKLVLNGKGIKTVRKRVSNGGRFKLTIVLTRKYANELKAGGTLKVKLRITYTPTGGRPRTHSKKIKLIRR